MEGGDGRSAGEPGGVVLPARMGADLDGVVPWSLDGVGGAKMDGTWTFAVCLTVGEPD